MCLILIFILLNFYSVNDTGLKCFLKYKNMTEIWYFCSVCFGYNPSGSVSVIKVGQVTFIIVGQVTLYFPFSREMGKSTSLKKPYLHFWGMKWKSMHMPTVEYR